MNIDLSILEACSKGDRKAQFELFQKCFGFILSICLRYYLNREDAKEVANMVFYKVLKNVGKYQPENSFKGWVRTISTNTIIDEYRKKKREKIKLELNGEMMPIKTNFNTSQIDVDVLKKMVSNLPENQRLAFNLVVIDGYSHKEFSTKTGIAEGTSKWLVHVARKSLQSSVKDYYKLNQNSYVRKT